MGSSGALRERLRIQQAQATPDGEGGDAVSWSDVVAVPAEFIPISASERVQAQGIQSDVQYRFRVRRTPDITSKMRAIWTPVWPPGAETETLEITGVLPEDAMFMLLEVVKAPMAAEASV